MNLKKKEDGEEEGNMSPLRSDVHASRELISLVLCGLEIVMCNYLTLVQEKNIWICICS